MHVIRKGVGIYFRISEDLRNSLEAIAGGSRRSLSAVVEDILFDHVQKKGTLPISFTEKRRHPRKSVSLAAFISLPGSQALCPGTIRDISYGGVRVLVANDSGVEILEDDAEVCLNVLLALPNEKTPVVVKCKPSRIRNNDGQIEIGAFFTGTDVASPQRLQRFLAQ